MMIRRRRRRTRRYQQTREDNSRTNDVTLKQQQSPDSPTVTLRTNQTLLKACPQTRRKRSETRILIIIISTNKGVNLGSKDVTRTRLQRPRSLTVTLTWAVCRYKVNKLRQRFILKFRKIGNNNAHTILFYHALINAPNAYKKTTVSPAKSPAHNMLLNHQLNIYAV